MHESSECRGAAFRRFRVWESRFDGQVSAWHPDSVRRRGASVLLVRDRLPRPRQQFSCLGCPESPVVPPGSWPTKNSVGDVGVCVLALHLPFGKLGRCAAGGSEHPSRSVAKGRPSTPVLQSFLIVYSWRVPAWEPLPFNQPWPCQPIPRLSRRHLLLGQSFPLHPCA